MNKLQLSLKFGEIKEFILNNKGSFLMIKKILLINLDAKYFLKEIVDKKIMVNYKLTDKNGTLMQDFTFYIASMIKCHIDYKLPVFDEYIRIPEIEFASHYPFELKIKFGSLVEEIIDNDIQAIFIIEIHDLIIK